MQKKKSFFYMYLYFLSLWIIHFPPSNLKKEIKIALAQKGPGGIISLELKEKIKIVSTLFCLAVFLYFEDSNPKNIVGSIQ